MKLNDSVLTGIAAGGARPAGAIGQPDGQRAGTPGSPGAGDRVELSRSAERLGALLASQAGARAQRVSSLARDFRSGRYQPDAQATSPAVVSETLSATAGEKAGSITP
jgi:hypothetical protein